MDWSMEGFGGTDTIVLPIDEIILKKSIGNFGSFNFQTTQIPEEQYAPINTNRTKSNNHTVVR